MVRALVRNFPHSLFCQVANKLSLSVASNSSASLSPTISLAPHIMFSISKAKRLIGWSSEFSRRLMSPFYLNCTRLLFCLTLNTARVFGILLSLSILLPWSVFSHLLPMWLPTLGPLSLLLWSSRFSGPRSVNAVLSKTLLHVQSSLIFPSFPRLFFPLSTRPLSSSQELLSSLPLFREDTSSQILLQTLRGVHLEQSAQWHY